MSLVPAIVSTSWGKTLAVPVRDQHARSLLLVVCKRTFCVPERGIISREEDAPTEVCLIDEHHGDDPVTSSIKRPSDVFWRKPGTEVLLVGHAHPASTQSTRVEVSLRFGPIQKRLYAHGLRAFQHGAFGALAAGPARSIQTPVPLRYELAWGGSDDSDPERPLADLRNTVGRGIARDPAKLLGSPAPQIDDGNSNKPIGFGALHRHWDPRRSFAGTYDDLWKTGRMPLLPKDFDERFFVSSPLDQWSPRPLIGNEPAEVIGATPSGRWEFTLPRMAPAFMSVAEGIRNEHPTHLDTILIDADTQRVELTYRVVIPMPRKLQLLERVVLYEKRVI